MKKKIFNIIFICLLLLIYYGKDYFYSFLSEKIFISTDVISTYENNTLEDYTYENSLYNYEITKILYRDIYNFNNEITIYKGLDYELFINMAIVDDYGLVGIISQVNETSSKVTLLTNEDTNLSIKVGSSYGILKYIDKSLVITNLTSNDFSLGDTIYTSGYSKINEGIKIGIVTTKKEDSLENVYFVELFSNFNNINYLVIIKDLL